MHVLLSNDDGLHAEGLQLLRRTLRESRPSWRVTTVAPDREQSASSHALTLTRPLRIEDHGEDQYAVSGTPTDCVLIAMNALLSGDHPDVVLSGINHGPNMGEDVHYSGTVAAAFEGRLLGVPSIALSLSSKTLPLQFETARHFVAELLPEWIERGFADETLLNVNIPAKSPGDVRGVKVCRLGSRRYEEVITRKEDPRGRAYYWIGGQVAAFRDDPETDFVLNEQGWITVTPLHVDLTHGGQLSELGAISQEW